MTLNQITALLAATVLTVVGLLMWLLATLLAPTSDEPVWVPVYQTAIVKQGPVTT